MNPSVSPARTGCNYSSSSICAEGTAGNSPGIHSWVSRARAAMRSPESRRDGGGSDDDPCAVVPCESGRDGGRRPEPLREQGRSLRDWTALSRVPASPVGTAEGASDGCSVLPTGLGGRAHPAKLFVHPRARYVLTESDRKRMISVVSGMEACTAERNRQGWPTGDAQGRT